MTGIDNGLGIGIGMAKNGPGQYDPLIMKFRNSKVYGESPASDCP